MLETQPSHRNETASADISSLPEWAQKERAPLPQGIPGVEDLSEVQREESEKLLARISVEDFDSPNFAAGMAKLMRQDQDQDLKIMDMQEDVLRERQKTVSPEEAKEIDRDLQTMRDASQIAIGLPSRWPSAAKMAQAAVFIGAGLELSRDPEAPAPDLDRPGAWARNPDLMPILIAERVAEIDKRIVLFRDLAHLPAMIEAREADRRGAELKLIAAAQATKDADLREAQGASAAEAPRSSAEVSSDLLKMDRGVINHEAAEASRERRMKLAGAREALAACADPISAEAMAIRHEMLADMLVLDPERRKSMMKAVAQGERSAEHEQAGIDRRATDLRGKAQGPAALSRMLTSMAREQADSLDEQGPAGFTRDQRVQMRSILRLADQSEGVLAPKHLTSMTNILMTKAASKDESRPEVLAMRRLISDLPEPARARRNEAELS